MLENSQAYLPLLTSRTRLDNDTLVPPALLCWLSRRYDKAGVEAAAGCEAGREWMLV